MQIHEITLRKQQPVTEGPMFDRIKALAGGLSQDPTFANADYNARLKILANNRVLDTIAKQAFSSWQAKHAQLVKTKGGPLADQEVKNQVTALIKQTMLPPYTELANLVNGQQIDQAINGFVRAFNAGNMDMAEQAMGTLAELGAAAVTFRQAQGVQPSPGTSAATAAPGAQAQPGAQQPAGDLRREVAQALTGVGVQNIPRQPGAMKQALSQMGANLTPSSTGDAHADSLLRLFGFEPQ
jgi:hypothetical protein